ncbi:MAG: glutamate ligase domain-containing protein, partial [bacterium]
MELFEYLAVAGVAFVNIDDPLIVKHAPESTRAISYGMTSTAKVSGTIATIDDLGRPTIRIENTDIRINSVGRHNASNALAAIAVGLEFGISLGAMKLALENLKLPGKRMEVIKQDNLVILNDTYNANPESTLAALQVLHTFPSPGKKVFVFGDMLELGRHARLEHAKIGKSLAKYNIDAFFAVGKMTAESVAAAQKTVAKLDARHFDSKQKLADALANLDVENATILVKGSRGMKMEEVVEVLLNR